MIVTPVHEGKRLDSFIASARVDLSRSRAQKLIADGFVKLNGELARVSSRVKEGDQVSLVIPAPEPVEVRPENISLDVVYEDGDIIVVNKPAGMVVHPGAGAHCGTMVNALLSHCPDLSGIGGVVRPGIVHRLDKQTSGLVAVAKNDTAHRSLAGQLKDRSMSRKYVAVVKGGPRKNEGTIESNIGRHRTHRKKMAVLKDGGRKAVTLYKVAQRLDSTSLLEISLMTGRTHQIRVHMRSINCPVVGDPVYGGKDATFGMARQALHAWRLSFIHPVSGAGLELKAPLPEDMETLIARLGGDPEPYL